MTGDGTYIYTYNALNQLTQVKRASDNAVIATYAYNHNGLKRSKTVNGVTITYNWDASGNLVRETTSGASTYFYWVGTKLVGLKKNGTTYIVHDNLRGDVESITDINGNIVAQAHYDPWGNSVASSGSLVQPMRYAGYYYDEETGLYYLKSRYYSPALGRFLTRDDFDYIDGKNPQTLNLYTYCLNNPVSFTDPEGTIAIVDDAVALAVIAVAVAITSWLGSETGQEYLRQTAASVWDALQEAKVYLSKKSETKERSSNPPAKRDKSTSKKDAYEKAKRAGKGNEPIHDPDGEYGPHYHPNVPMPKNPTPKAPNPHDHYYYPK